MFTEEQESGMIARVEEARDGGCGGGGAEEGALS